jgi:hypothetical protein
VAQPRHAVDHRQAQRLLRRRRRRRHQGPARPRHRKPDATHTIPHQKHTPCFFAFLK